MFGAKWAVSPGSELHVLPVNAREASASSFQNRYANGVTISTLRGSLDNIWNNYCRKLLQAVIEKEVIGSPIVKKSGRWINDSRSR